MEERLVTNAIVDVQNRWNVLRWQKINLRHYAEGRVDKILVNYFISFEGEIFIPTITSTT